MSRIPPLKRLYCVLSNERGSGDWPTELGGEIFSRLNHLADVYVLSEDLQADRRALAKILNGLRTHLDCWGFCRVNLRPVHPVGRQVEALKSLYRGLVRWADPFFQEALSHQVGSRWMVLPVLRARSAAEQARAQALAGFLRERLIIPSIMLRPSPTALNGSGAGIDTDRERLLIESAQGPLATVAQNDLFDELLSWSQASGGGLEVEACSSLVVDTVQQRVSRCFNLAGHSYDRWTEAFGEDPQEECLACRSVLPAEMRATLQYNCREAEGLRVEFQLGLYAFLRGQPERARAHLERLADAELLPELQGECLLYLGLLHLQRQEVEKAHDLLSRARELRPASGVVHYHLGRCEFAWRDYIAAADLFHEALSLGVSADVEAELRIYLGIAHVQLEEYGEAMQALETAPDHEPTVLFYRAMAYLGREQVSEALAQLRLALKLGPSPEDLPSVYFYIGHCLKEMGDCDEALEPLQQALQNDPRSYEAWNLLGYCRFRLGRHHDAIEAFLKALEINPGSAIDYANIGSNLRDLGEPQQAVEWYEKALRLDPTLGFAASNLKKLNARRNKE
jgi:tetratricopeptide (TPR) repeat protein